MITLINIWFWAFVVVLLAKLVLRGFSVALPKFVFLLVAFPFAPFITAYHIRKEKPVQSALIILLSILLLLALLFLWFIQR